MYFFFLLIIVVGTFIFKDLASLDHGNQLPVGLINLLRGSKSFFIGESTVLLQGLPHQSDNLKAYVSTS